jgi:hypothetical protein
MKPKTYLQIPEPCHENWHNMLPTEQGKFCNACSKQVVDFTYMTDQQVLSYFNVHSNVCGSFNDTQLNRALQPALVQQKQSWWLALILPLLMLFDKGKAQKGKVAANVVAVDTSKMKLSKPVLDIEPLIGDSVQIILGGASAISKENKLLIVGKVIDENNQPLSSATITLIKGKATITDTSGFFSLEVSPHKGDSIELHISYVGYETKTIKISARDAVDNIIDAGIIQCKAQVMGLSEIVVVAGFAICKRSTGLTSTITYSEKNIIDTIKNIFRDDFIKVFPNPVNKTKPLKLSFAKDNNYEIQLIDNYGRVVLLQQTAAIKDAVIDLSIPPNIAAGMYYIVAYGSDKKKHTAKLIIQ